AEPHARRSGPETPLTKQSRLLKPQTPKRLLKSMLTAAGWSLARLPGIGRECLGNGVLRRTEIIVWGGVCGLVEYEFHGAIAELLVERRELGGRGGEDERLVTGVLDGSDGGDDRGGLDGVPDISLEAAGDGGVGGCDRHVARSADGLAELQHHLGVDDQHRPAFGD